MVRRIESLLLDGPAGKLEALLEEPEEGMPTQMCVVCHPHPLFGGTMRNKVVHRMARGMRLAGSVVLRFNFRGVERSDGKHAEGTGEIEDARIALGWLGERYPGLPASLAGFSFGSRVVLKLGCSIPSVKRVIAVGFPANRGDLFFLNHCGIPKHFIHSINDVIAPKEPLQMLFSSIAEPKSLDLIAATDHFFAGGLDQLEQAVTRLART